jgi:hypothetical protein
MKSICRPQVALILDMNSEIVRFFLCELTGGGSCVKGLDFETLPNDALWKYGIMAMTTDTTATKKKYGVE